MSNETKLKILLLGPISSGRTTIANFLSNSTENFIGEYRPTKGVRIVEFVAQGVRGKGIFQSGAEIELWDCSGDHRAEVRGQPEVFLMHGLEGVPDRVWFCDICDKYNMALQSSKLWPSIFTDPMRYQSCWPSFKHKTDGIIFVYSQATNHQKTDLEMLYGFFVEDANFPENCCLVIKNEFGSGNNEKNIGNPLANLSHLTVNLEEKGSEFRRSFNSFISDVIKANSKD